MGLVKAAFGAAGGTLADQWKDFLTVPPNIHPTAALFPAVPSSGNAGRGSNSQASNSVITNGSKIVIPEGYGLLVFEDAELTGFSAEPGEYIWDSDQIYSQSVFVGDGASSALVQQSWERFKFGGRPGAQQVALFVSLKELPNNKFGTQSPVYWDDSYLNSQVGAITHGTYSVRILDPIRFVKEFVPATYLQGGYTFDFTDRANPAANQLFAEVVGSLASAFSLYTNSDSRANRISRIQSDSIGFARSLSQAVESAYAWTQSRGISLTQVTIVGIEYDEPTTELLKTVQRADALDGRRGNANLQASVAAGMEAAGENAGANGILGMGVASGTVGIGGLMQEPQQNPPSPTIPEAIPAGNSGGAPDLVSQLQSLKQALEAGLIDQAEFDAAKAKALGLA